MNNFQRNIYRTAYTISTITCYEYTLATSAATGQTFTYTDCNGNPQSDSIGGVGGYDATTVCARSIDTYTVEITVVNNGLCPPPVGPSYYNLFFSNSTPSLPCGSPSIPVTYPISLFCVHSIPVAGDFIYTNSGLTSPFPGDGTFYWISLAFGFQINGSGEIISVIDCS